MFTIDSDCSSMIMSHQIMSVSLCLRVSVCVKQAPKNKILFSPQQTSIIQFCLIRNSFHFLTTTPTTNFTFILSSDALHILVFRLPILILCTFTQVMDSVANHTRWHSDQPWRQRLRVLSLIFSNVSKANCIVCCSYLLKNTTHKKLFLLFRYCQNCCEIQFDCQCAYKL